MLMENEYKNRNIIKEINEIQNRMERLSIYIDKKVEKIFEKINNMQTKIDFIINIIGINGDEFESNDFNFNGN